jgi:hypothetical protein
MDVYYDKGNVYNRLLLRRQQLEEEEKEIEEEKQYEIVSQISNQREPVRDITPELNSIIERITVLEILLGKNIEENKQNQAKKERQNKTNFCAIFYKYICGCCNKIENKK